MNDDDRAGGGLTEAGRERLADNDSWLRSFVRCAWCAEYVHKDAPGGRVGRVLFCDEDCKGLWTRWRWELRPDPVISDSPGFGGQVRAQVQRKLEEEKADEADGLTGLYWLDMLDELRWTPRCVKYWLFSWPDGTVVVVAAETREEAIDALKERTKRTTRDLRPIPEEAVDGYTLEQMLQQAEHRAKFV